MLYSRQILFNGDYTAFLVMLFNLNYTTILVILLNLKYAIFTSNNYSMEIILRFW